MAISRPEIDGVIEAYVRLQFRVAAGDAAFSRDAHLFEGGYVDSAGVVELLMFVESTFGVKLGDEDIFSDEFTTISGISGLVANLRTHHDDCGSYVPER
jgi:acyl carrier protein